MREVLLAAHSGDTELVMRWLRGGGDMNDVDKRSGDTLLIAAAVGGQVRLVRRFVSLSANVDQQSAAGLTALMGAVSQPGPISSVTAKVLLQAGAKLNLQSKTTGLTALTFAVQKNFDSAVVLTLVQARADLDLQTTCGSTALSSAAYLGRTDVVEMLVKGGAQLDLQNDEGATALMGAAQRGHTNAIRALLRAGADPSIRSAADKLTARQLAEAEGHTMAADVLRLWADEQAAKQASEIEEAEALAERSANADAAMAALLAEEAAATPAPAPAKDRGRRTTRRPRAKSSDCSTKQVGPPSCDETVACWRRASGEGRQTERSSNPEATRGDDTRSVAGSCTPLGSPRGRWERNWQMPTGLEVPCEVQRYLDALHMGQEDRQAAAALLARRRSMIRHSN